MVRLRGFQKLTSVDDALRAFLSALPVRGLKPVTVPLRLALNRVSAQDIIAKADLPAFDRSAVDGYAVKAKDTTAATQHNPRILQLTEEVVNNDQARQVWTGNQISKYADAVVMLEDVARINSRIKVWGPVTPGENISKKGEDIHKGEMALEVGTRLKPQHLGLMAALGIAEAEVFEKPKIAVLATGNELVEPGGKLTGNQTFDINRLIISALCYELGAEPLDLGVANDDVGEIAERLKIGLEIADLTITSGGTSVGGPDLVPEAVNKIGKPGVIVHGIAVRPAMPTALAVVNGEPLIILPGNPVAAMVGFEVFARPLIGRLLGLEHMEARFMVQAIMTRRIATTLGRKNYVRVRVFQKRNKLLAEPISARGSSMISTMTKANGYVVVPENREGLDEGESVTVYMFDDIRGR